MRENAYARVLKLVASTLKSIEKTKQEYEVVRPSHFDYRPANNTPTICMPPSHLTSLGKEKTTNKSERQLKMQHFHLMELERYQLMESEKQISNIPYGEVSRETQKDTLPRSGNILPVTLVELG